MGYFFFNDTATTEIYTLSLHDALPIYLLLRRVRKGLQGGELLHKTLEIGDDGRHLGLLEHDLGDPDRVRVIVRPRSEEHTSELQSRQYLVCRLLLEKKTTSPPPSSQLP